MLLKKVIFISVLFILTFNVFSQDKIVLELNDDISFGGNGSNGFDFAFSIKSLDKRFQFDTYLFNTPNWKTFDEKIKLDELKKEVDFEINKTIKIDDLKNIGACEMHEMFSLTKTIYFIKKQQGKYFYWKITYKGTIKDVFLSGYQGII